jgi:hypothetical protein
MITKLRLIQLPAFLIGTVVVAIAIAAIRNRGEVTVGNLLFGAVFGGAIAAGI